MLVIEVDRRHAETLQAAFHGSSHILRTAIEAAHERIPGVAQDAKLCREEYIVSPTFDGASDKFFVGVRTVDVGGVEKVDAKLKRAMDRGNRFGVVSPCIKIAHPHAAEAKSRYLRTIAAQLSCLHWPPTEKQDRRLTHCIKPDTVAQAIIGGFACKKPVVPHTHLRTDCL